MNVIEKDQFEIFDDGLLIRAPAKINLSLLIAGKRPDGFHEIETIMAKVNFYDEILIEPNPKSGIEFICTGPVWAPAGKDNLVYKTCELLLKNCDIKPNIKITLTKNIPAGSGLGSASSDSAATLKGLNKYLKLSLSDKKLMKIASQLGSDVAFFLGGPLALCTGKGEKIKSLNKIFNFSAVLILPEVNCSTQKVYENYKHDSILYKKLSKTIKTHIQENRFDLIAKMCTNMLQESCFTLHKKVNQLKTDIESLGESSACLTGSGSAVYCVADNLQRARQLQNQLKIKIGCKSIVVSNNRW